MTEPYRLISEGQWRYMHRKLNDLQSSVLKLQRELNEVHKPKRGLRFWEAIPPKSVCSDINSMLTGVTSYDGFLNRLGDYYGVERMRLYRDDNVDKKYKAVYSRSAKACYSRGPTIGRRTVLHEFFHHLTSLGVVFVPKKQEEEHADKFADVFLQRAGWCEG